MNVAADGGMTGAAQLRGLGRSQPIDGGEYPGSRRRVGKIGPRTGRPVEGFTEHPRHQGDRHRAQRTFHDLGFHPFIRRTGRGADNNRKS